MTKIKLDRTDRKILYELDFNSRQTISRIAKKLKLSRDIVSYRMNKFLKEGVLLKHYAIIDIAKLGYAAHKNFIRFQNITQEKESEFIEFIKTHPKVVYSASYDGRFDIVVSIWAKNVEDLSNTLIDMDSKFGDYIAERQIATIIRGEYCVRDYLIGKKTFTQRKYFFGSTPQKISIDVTNKKILIELGQDSRASSVEIANKLNMSADAIYQRIRKLENSGVIQNYNIIPNEEFYPYTHYKILISLHNLNEQKEKKLEEYCRAQKNIWYFCPTLGPWSFEIDLDVENRGEFRNILREIKLHFSDIIKDYTVLNAFRTNKYNFCPSMP